MAHARNPSTVTKHIPFGKKLSDRLRDFAQGEGALLPLVTLTAYVAAICRWLDQRDLVLLFVSHGRRGHPELEDMIGPLEHLLFLRVEIAREDSYLDLLKRVTSEFQFAQEHRDFNRVLDLIPGCATEVSFNWMPAEYKKPTGPVENNEDTLRIRPFPLKPAPILDAVFLVSFSDTPAGIGATLVYRPDLVATSTTEQFFRSLRSITAEIAEHPSARVLR